MEKDRLIEKWLDGALSEAEAADFNRLEEATKYERIVRDAAAFKASHFSEMPSYEAFRQQLAETAGPKRDETAEPLRLEKTQDRSKLRWLRPVFRVASLLVVGLGIYFFLFFNPATEVSTQMAQTTTVALPDASQVTLNAGSHIEFRKGNWDRKREVALQGEAFFDVAKGSRFDVVTPQGMVRVTGTEFNVKQRGALLEVTCYEGSVLVVAGQHRQQLEVGDRFLLLDGEATDLAHRDSTPSWMMDKSSFTRIPVSEVFKELERQYGVTVTLENVSGDELFSGSFSHGDLQAALTAVCDPLKLSFRTFAPNKIRVWAGEK